MCASSIQPRLPPRPRRQTFHEILIMSLALGLVGGLSLAFILESRDNTVHSLEQVRVITALPSLAVIPLSFRSNQPIIIITAKPRAAQPRGRWLPRRARNQRSRSPTVLLRTSILLSKTGQVGQGLDGNERSSARRQDHDERKSRDCFGAAGCACAAYRSRHAPQPASRTSCISSRILA